MNVDFVKVALSQDDANDDKETIEDDLNKDDIEKEHENKEQEQRNKEPDVHDGYTKAGDYLYKTLWKPRFNFKTIISIGYKIVQDILS